MKNILVFGLMLILIVFGCMYLLSVSLSGTVDKALPYGVSEKDVVCQRLKDTSRFTECQYGMSDEVIRLCQEYGERTFNETNSTVNFKYCEDYRFTRSEDNITVLRVR